MAKIIDGNAIARRICERIEEEGKALHIKPGLAVVVVGDDHSSELYIRRISVVLEEHGFSLEKHQLDVNVAEQELIPLIKQLNNNPYIHGILVQRPLPKPIDEQKVIEAINPDKDVDGFLTNSPFVPCTARGILSLLKEVTSIEGKHAVVIGRSPIVGKPTALLLLNENATVTVCHSKTKNLAAYTQHADILVAAVGKHRMITANMMKAGAVVIDVGVTTVDGKLVGDVDFDNVKEKVLAITPVPGGVGPMTIAMLMENVLIAAKRREADE